MYLELFAPPFFKKKPEIVEQNKNGAKNLLLCIIHTCTIYNYILLTKAFTFENINEKIRKIIIIKKIEIVNQN